MKVLALTRYGQLGASSRIRCYQYVPALETHGIDVDVTELLPDDYVRRLHAGRRPPPWTLAGWYLKRVRDLIHAHRYDLLWVGHEIFPGLPAAAERLLARIGPPYVVETDDARFHQYDLSGSRMRRALLGRKIDIVMARAAMVIAGNHYLAARAKDAGARHVELLPSVVDAERYSVRPKTDGPFTIGWIGSPTTAKYLHLIRDVLADAVARGARLVAIGATPETLPDLPFDIRPWSEQTEADEIAHFDVGIMPLSDGPWEQGKCGYKLIQYMACGRPVIASAVGANISIVEDGATGFLASTDADWTNALMALEADASLRMQLGVSGRRVVERRFSLQANAPILAELLKTAAAGCR